jgi:hypothetical protein
MEPLENILKRFQKEYGLEERLTDEEVRLLVYRHIDQDMVDFVRAVWLEGNVLVIQCTEPVAIQEFQIRAEGIRIRINRDAGRAALASVKLTLHGTQRKRRL